jgi:predicted DNA-binding transcriptional regulator AlpA
VAEHLQPLAVDARAAAALFGLGRSSWFKLVSAGRTPRPRRLGRRVLYDVAELKDWWAAGAPARDIWESSFPTPGAGKCGGAR